ncbi:MAG: hypothetical protein V9G63_13315 [Candidatus Competibacter sp.]
MALAIVLYLLLLVIFVLNAWATRVVMLDKFLSPKQRLAQTLFIWLIPVIGPLLVLNLNGEADRSTGRYREQPNLGEDFGHSNLAFRQTRQALESETAHHGIEISED